MIRYFLLIALLLASDAFPQSAIENTVKAGQLLLGGLTILKSGKTNPDKESLLVSSVCVKNKLSEKITFTLEGQDARGEEISRELIVQNDGRECVFNIPKGVYSYAVTLPSKEVYKKGEYKFEEDVIITIKKDD